MKLLVVRHAEASHNVLNISHSDPLSGEPHLTAKGVGQAEKLAQSLQTEAFDVIFTSELTRTIETATILNRYHDIPMHTDARINDIRTGLEGQPFDKFQEALSNSADPWNARFGDGESFKDEKLRTIAFLHSLEKADYRYPLIVTHGGIANIIYGVAHHLPNEEMFNRQIDNTDMFLCELGELTTSEFEL